MRIILDQDQVICQWVERILQWYNEDKGTTYTRDDIKSWNVKMNLGDHSEDFLRSAMRYPEFYRDLDPVEGALYGVKKLLSDGHDVIIATAVPKCAGIAYHGKLEWIRRVMPFFPLENFIAIHRKDLLIGDVLLDDGLHNIVPFMKSGRMAVAFDCPWNRGYDDVTRRVRHWNEFLAFIDEVKEQFEETPPNDHSSHIFKNGPGWMHEVKR